MKSVNYFSVGFLFLAAAVANPSYGQKKSNRITITGYAVDVNKYPVNGAMILIDKINTSAATDERGFYRIRVRPSASQIGIYSVVHGLIEEPVNGRTRINFTFPVSVLTNNNIPQFKPEDEEINIGYGSVKRKNLTSSVSKINGLDRRFDAYTSIYDMLQGTVPGLTVSRGRIFIRGISSKFMSTEPLFVVDGTPVSSIADIPPQNVESIQVLKGPAGSIYGARGANGVILIDQIGANPYTTAVNQAEVKKVPSAETRFATDIRKKSVTLNGVVNANDLPTTVIFEYGTTPEHGFSVSATQSPVSGNYPINVDAQITGLKSGVTYYYRVTAVNSLGKATGIDIPFRYTGEIAYAETQPATNTSPRAAILNGIVNPRGLPTVVTFEYGQTNSYGIKIPALQNILNGPAAAMVSANLTDLRPGMEYHYRIVAENEEGITYGDDMIFRSEYVIGEYLHGGYIFYVDPAGEHGLVCSATDLSKDAIWGSCIPQGASGRSIGTGYQNTLDIINGCQDEITAAGLCNKLELNGYDDWYLPSVDELMLMQTNLDMNGIGNFGDSYYWSSTHDRHGAWVVNFFYGSKSNQPRDKNAVRTRAVRRF